LPGGARHDHVDRRSRAGGPAARASLQKAHARAHRPERAGRRIGARPARFSDQDPGSEEPASTKNQNANVTIAETAVVTSTKSSTVTSGRESSSPRKLLIQGRRTRTVETRPVTDW